MMLNKVPHFVVDSGMPVVDGLLLIPRRRSHVHKLVLAKLFESRETRFQPIRYPRVPRVEESILHNSW